jgi:hypothetical protein
MHLQVWEKRKKMKKLKQNRYLILGLIALNFGAVFSQKIEKCYINLPDVLDPTMSKKNRLELLEYHKAGQGDSLANKFGNQVFLQVFDTLNNLIVVKNTSSSTLEMKMFISDKNPSFIGIIHTVCGPICQSTISFYDTAWNQIPLRFTMPKAIEWVDKEKLNSSGLDSIWVRNVLENSFVSLCFDPKDSIIIAENHSSEFLSDENKKALIPLLAIKTFSYSLVGRTWVRQ